MRQFSIGESLHCVNGYSLIIRHDCPPDGLFSFIGVESGCDKNVKCFLQFFARSYEDDDEEIDYGDRGSGYNNYYDYGGREAGYDNYYDYGGRGSGYNNYYDYGGREAGYNNYYDYGGREAGYNNYYDYGGREAGYDNYDYGAWWGYYPYYYYRRYSLLNI